MHAVMMNMNTFNTRISGTHAHSQTPRLKANKSAAVDPLSDEVAFDKELAEDAADAPVAEAAPAKQEDW